MSAAPPKPGAFLAQVRARAWQIQLLGLSVLSRLIGALGVFAVARTLGVSAEVDALLTSQTAGMVGQALFSAGFTQTVVLATRRARATQVRRVFIGQWGSVYLLTAASLAAAALLGGALVMGWLSGPHAQFGALALVATGPGLGAVLVSQRLVALGRNALCLALPALPAATMGLALLCSPEPSASTAMLAHVAGVVLQLAISLLVVDAPARLAAWCSRATRRALAEGAPFMGAALLFVPVPLLDALLVQQLGPGAVSTYQFGMRIPLAVSAVVTAVLTPLASQRFADADALGVQGVFEQMRRHLPGVLALSLLSGAASALIAWLLMPWMLQDAQAAATATWVAVAGFGTSIASIAGSFTARAIATLRSASLVARLAAISLAVRMACSVAVLATGSVVAYAAVASLTAAVGVALKYHVLRTRACAAQAAGHPG